MFRVFFCKKLKAVALASEPVWGSCFYATASLKYSQMRDVFQDRQHRKTAILIGFGEFNYRVFKEEICKTPKKTKWA